ncbi:MAG: acetyl-CoA carboxylase, carboxyltransferase subunit beta [Planctomycetota bacterium]|nr:acetyl-CoA carboxylase, carboxyltransferase subunit beta [Planctomycetota bacterium]
MPDGLWMRCGECETMLYRKAVAENLEVCPECGWHFRIGASERIGQLTDPDTFEELFSDIAPADPLGFRWMGKNYAEYLVDYKQRANTDEGVLTGMAYIKGRRVALGVMNGDFIGGSLASVMGERLLLLIEKAVEVRLPLILVCSSGGMRMQEGALSLMQMGKTSSALARFDEAGGLFISVLADPTYGGTTASFAMLGDIIIAEPGARIGFAGQRVIANTIKTELPEGFQRAEFLLEHGFIDRIVPRHELRSEIARLIDYCRP